MPATPDDAPDIARIHVTAWQQAYAGIVPETYLVAMSIEERRTRWHKTIVEGPGEVAVARIDDRVIGWVAFGACRDADAAPKAGEIWAIYIDPSTWSQGVGGALWQHARARLSEQGFERISLWVLVDNARAIGFYRQAGFAPDSDTGGVKQFTLAGTVLSEARYWHRM